MPFLATATAPALPAKEGAAPERHLLKAFILNLSSSTSGHIFRCQFAPVFLGYAMAFHFCVGGGCLVFASRIGVIVSVPE